MKEKERNRKTKTKRKTKRKREREKKKKKKKKKYSSICHRIHYILEREKSLAGIVGRFNTDCLIV